MLRSSSDTGRVRARRLVTWPSGEIAAATSSCASVSSSSSSSWLALRSRMRSLVIEAVCVLIEASVSAFDCGVEATKRGAGRGASRSNEAPGVVFRGVEARVPRAGVCSGEWLSKDGVGFRFAPRVAEGSPLTCTGERAALSEVCSPPLIGVTIGVDERKIPPSSSSIGIGAVRGAALASAGSGPSSFRLPFRGDGVIHGVRKRSVASEFTRCLRNDDAMGCGGRNGDGGRSDAMGDVGPIVDCGANGLLHAGAGPVVRGALRA